MSDLSQTSVLRRLLEHHFKVEKCAFHLSPSWVMSLLRIRYRWLLLWLKQWLIGLPQETGRRFIFYLKCIQNFELWLPQFMLWPPMLQFPWSAQTEWAFRLLKNLFTTRPILPQLSREVIVGMHVSDLGMGRRYPTSCWVINYIPVSFFRVYSAVQNYCVGDLELLAIELALEEWWYCGVDRSQLLRVLEIWQTL